MAYLVGDGSTVVSGRVCKARVPGSIFRYPLATFLSLVLPLSGQRLPKLLLYCPRTGLTTLYAFESVAGVASLVLNIFMRERKHSRHQYKNVQPTPNNGQRQSKLTFIKLTDTNSL